MFELILGVCKPEPDPVFQILIGRIGTDPAKKGPDPHNPAFNGSK